MKTIAIIDLNRTLFDPETNAEVEGATEILAALNVAGVELHLVSKKEPGRERIVEELGFRDFFASVSFVAEKTPELFEGIMREANGEPARTYVVGDYLPQEICAGNKCGMKTIWLRRGRFGDMGPQKDDEVPWREISKLEELQNLIA